MTSPSMTPGKMYLATMGHHSCNMLFHICAWGGANLLNCGTAACMVWHMLNRLQCGMHDNSCVAAWNASQGLTYHVAGLYGHTS